MNLPKSRSALAWLTTIALALVALAAVAASIWLVWVADSAARSYPEFRHLEAPLLIASLALIACVEGILVVTGILVWRVRADRIFLASALRLVSVLVVLLAAGTAIVVVIIPLVPGPPVLVLGLVGIALVGVTVTFVVVVLRALLRRVSVMREELEGVV